MCTSLWYSNLAARDWRCRPSAPEVAAFHAGLPGYAATRLVELPALAAELGVRRVFVKDESSRFGLPAFKFLGASWAVASVIADRAGLTGPLTLEALRAASADDPLTLITATDGNHGRAVARLAAMLGLPAHVVVPDVIARAAAEAIAAEGAVLTTVQGSYDQAVEHAAGLAAGDRTAVLVQDTAWPGYEQIPGWIVEGYQTLLTELDAQLREAGEECPTLIAVPVGVGSLAQAVISHYRGRPEPGGTAILAVEPDTAACVLESLVAGAPRSVPTAATVMAGLNCGTPSSLAWPFFRHGVDAAVAVTDTATVRAVDDLSELGVSSGPSGAASLAGVRAALTGRGSVERRGDLSVDADSVVVLLSTERRDPHCRTDTGGIDVISTGQQTDTPQVRIDRDRLWRTLMELKEIGSYDDPTTGLRGVQRLALTDADAEARRRVIAWMEEAGLRVRIDRIGNVYGTREGRDRALPCVLMGSHIDTVASGGAFDGTLGVLGAIEVVRTLNENDVTTLRPIEVGFFTEEEGVRFGTDMLGSAVTAGRLTLDHARGLCDEQGATVGAELVRTGFDGDTHERRPVPHAYLECHIEQGPILADAGVDVGIVTGVQAISWQRLRLHGEAAHAGTTPIEHRHDAGLAAAVVIVEVRRMCDSGRFGALRGTVGRLTVGPGQTNVIPATATLTVDLRNPDDAAMAAAEAHLDRFVSGLQATYGVTGTLERMARTAVVPFDPEVQKLLADTADRLGLGYVSTMSGAGHDAQELAAICPTAMVFVAGEHGGISHTPREYSRPAACGNGIDVLANAVLRLADQAD